MLIPIKVCNNELMLFLELINRGFLHVNCFLLLILFFFFFLNCVGDMSCVLIVKQSKQLV